MDELKHWENYINIAPNLNLHYNLNNTDFTKVCKIFSIKKESSYIINKPAFNGVFKIYGYVPYKSSTYPQFTKGVKMEETELYIKFTLDGLDDNQSTKCFYSTKKTNLFSILYKETTDGYDFYIRFNEQWCIVNVLALQYTSDLLFFTEEKKFESVDGVSEVDYIKETYKDVFILESGFTTYLNSLERNLNTISLRTIIQGSFDKNTAISNGILLGTVPNMYRPSQYQECPCICKQGNTVLGMGVFTIGESGKMYLNYFPDNTNNIVINASYIAMFKMIF